MNDLPLTGFTHSNMVYRDHRGRDYMIVRFITTSAIGEFEPNWDEVYSIQYYVIKFVSDFHQ